MEDDGSDAEQEASEEDMAGEVMEDDTVEE